MKTVDEWLQAFNLLYNNIASDKAPGLEPYEISKFLTDAQLSIVIALYKGSFGNAFEATEDNTEYLSTLVRQASVSDGTISGSEVAPHIVDGSVVYKLPDDILFRTLELCKITKDCRGVESNLTVAVVPVTQDEFQRTVRNPFKKQNRDRVLRLSMADNTSTDGTYSQVLYSELVSDYPITDYIVRYICRPKPIILEDLVLMSIDGEKNAQTCLLPESLHQTILAEAVRLAKASWVS